MADDDLDFDFEGTLAKEAETYQGASVSQEGDGAGRGRRHRETRPPQAPRHQALAPVPF